jgi:CheY-like chemotaxis protein
LFWFTLPLAGETRSPPPPALPPLPLVVLVIDDNAHCREILLEVLAPWRVRALEAATVEEGIARAGRESVDAVLVDAGLLDGPLDALVAALGRGGRLPRIAVMDHFGRTPRGGEGGRAPDGVLSKPIGPAALRRWLEGQPRGAVDSSPQAAASPGAALAGVQVLVAEDNLVNQRVVLHMIRRLGGHADIAMNGRQAVAAAERGAYEIILMDVQMPEMDGYDATRCIRERLPGERQPWIIALTANALLGDRERCLSAGMDDFLTKPLVLDALEAAVRRRAPASRRTCLV